jgi:hypothetical protein
MTRKLPPSRVLASAALNSQIKKSTEQGAVIFLSACAEPWPDLRSVSYAEFLKDFLGVPARGVKADAARVRDFLRGLAVCKASRNLELAYREIVLLLQRDIGESRLRCEANESHGDSQLGAE